MPYNSKMRKLKNWRKTEILSPPKQIEVVEHKKGGIFREEKQVKKSIDDMKNDIDSQTWHELKYFEKEY